MTTRSTRTGVGTLALVLALAAGASEAVAQQRRQPFNRQQMERQIQERFQEQVRNELGLTEEEGEALRRVVADHHGQRRELVGREMQLRQRLRSTGSLLSEEEAREVLEEMARIQEEEARLLRVEQEALLTVLTPEQTVRFYTLRADLAERIRRLQRGPGGPGGAAGAPAGRWPPSQGLGGTLPPG